VALNFKPCGSGTVVENSSSKSEIMGSNRVTGREGENDIALFGVLYNLFYNDLINEAFFQEKALCLPHLDSLRHKY